MLSPVTSVLGAAQPKANVRNRHYRFGAIAPSATTFRHVHDAADHAAVFYFIFAPHVRPHSLEKLVSSESNYLFVGEQRASDANQGSVLMPGTSLEASPGTRVAPRTRT